jgi:hypothetical protein
MRRLYVLLTPAVIATTLIVVAAGASAGPPHPAPSPNPGAPKEYLALAISPSLIKVPYGDAGYAPEAAEALGTTLKAAQDAALAKCESQGVANERYYKDDCQGGVWVRSGYIAFATENLVPGTDPTQPAYRYRYAYGGAYGTTQNKAKGKAIDNCYLKDPQYNECVLVDGSSSEGTIDLSKHKGGPW